MNDETALTIYTGSQQIGDVVEFAHGDMVMSLEQCILKWIDESFARAESQKTRTAYRDTFASFRAALHSRGLDADSDRAAIAPIADEWAGTSLRVGSHVAPATFNQRIAIISSFYKFAIKHEVLDYNPIIRVKRRKLGKRDAAKPLSESQVKSGLQQIDRETAEGLRDYALLSIALVSGHRASELAGLRMKHLRKQGATCVVEWERCKGNENRTSVLSAKATAALYTYLHKVYGSRLLSLAGDAPVWVSFSRRNAMQAIGPRTIANMCEEFLGSSKVHTTRHTAALKMLQSGASLEDIRKFLGHKNAATTAIYIETTLVDYANPYATALEEAFGI